MTAEDDILEEILEEETLDEIMNEVFEEEDYMDDSKEHNVLGSEGPTEKEIYEVAKKLQGYACELDEDLGILEELLNRNVAVCTKDGEWARGGMWKKYMRSNG